MTPSAPPTLFMEEAVRVHGKRVFNLSLRVTGNRHDAEDVFQEVFLRVWKAGKTFADLDRPDSWIYRVTLNAALDSVERRRRSHAGVPPAAEGGIVNGNAPSPEGTAMDRELRTLLRARVESLPRAQREVFLLRNDEGLSYREIAGILLCPEERARANFYQAMKSLRKSMQEVIR